MRFLNKYVFFNLLMLLSLNAFSTQIVQVFEAKHLKIVWPFCEARHFFPVWIGFDERGRSYHMISASAASRIGISERTLVSEIYFYNWLGEERIAINFQPGSDTTTRYPYESVHLSIINAPVPGYDPSTHHPIVVYTPMVILDPDGRFNNPNTLLTSSAESCFEWCSLESGSLFSFH